MEEFERIAGIAVPRVLRWVWTAIALIVVLGVLRIVGANLTGVPLGKYMLPELALDAERTVPAWFAAILLALVSGAMLLAARLAKLDKLRTARPWAVLGWIFLYMSMDEMLSIHEGLDSVGATLVPIGGVFHYGWVVIGIVAAAAAGLGFIPFLLRLPRQTALRLVVSGAVYVFGALGLEMLGGALAESLGTGLVTQLTAAAEESFELIGLGLALWTTLGHLARESAVFAFEDGAVRR